MKPEQPQSPQQPSAQVPPQYEQPQPVAYDSAGQPLYRHPPQVQPAAPAPVGQPTPQPVQPAAATSGPQPQVVFMSRPMEPLSPHISEKAKQRHDESKRRFPFLNISEGEYVISNIRRHPIGLITVWLPEAVAIILFTLLYSYSLTPKGAETLLAMGITLGGMTWIGFLIVLLLGLLGWAGSIIYLANQFYLTNESVIQFIQTGLFARKEQTISLQNIEDASFRQHGILQHLLDYGTIRLSTEGEETTYRFYFAQNPRQQIALLNNAVESFKNGRPVGDSDS